jgi:drug/metabolite transporter (DMT)-like permease
MTTAALLLLVATVCWGLWGFANKQALGFLHPLDVQWIYYLPYVAAAPICYALARRSGVEFVPSQPGIFWSLAAGVCAATAFFCYMFALRGMPASGASAVSSAYPLITMALAIAMRQESFSIDRLIGCLLIIGGLVWLTVRG